jgi:hypothetical protein
MVPHWAERNIRIHPALENAIPSFALDRYRPRPVGVKATLDALYAGAALNRKELPTMVNAACARDEATLEAYRRRAGMRAAEILADALYSILARPGR